MLLAFDIGNSSISIGVFDVSSQKNELLTSFKISNKPYSADEYFLLIKNFLELYGYSSIEKSVIASVVPRLTDIIKDVAVKLCGCQPFIISGGTKTGFGIKIKNPEQLGADIVCNVAAALNYEKAPLVILDMGTATTLTVVDAVGAANAVVGTVIMPGLAISMNALTDSAALLGNVRLQRENTLIGRDTDEAINSGVINGNVFAIDGFLRNIRDSMIPKNVSSDEKNEKKLSLIATGGLTKHIIPYTKNKFRYIENLTLEGAAYLFAKNVVGKVHL